MLRLGVVGAGAIAPPYYMAMAAWLQLALRSCTSRSMESARAAAARYGAKAVPFEVMLADPDIDAIVNLTPIPAHFEIGCAVLNAGKHLYTEKPLAATFEQAQALVALAKEKGRRIGCAPDTFFGAAHQAARAAVDAGEIGTPITGAIHLGAKGVELWHPQPESFYAPGGGPVADLGPYYLAQMINLLGPIAEVTGIGRRPFPVRTIGHPSRRGDNFQTQVDTTTGAVLAFENGTLVTLAMSWDAGSHARQPIELVGTAGALLNPDPNWSDGLVELVGAGGARQAIDHSGRLFHRPTMISFQGTSVAYYRLCGLADMADAILQGRPHRASGELALHVMEAVEAVRLSSMSGRRIALKTSCARPAPIGNDISHADAIQPFGEHLLDARTLF